MPRSGSVLPRRAAIDGATTPDNRRPACRRMWHSWGKASPVFVGPCLLRRQRCIVPRPTLGGRRHVCGVAEVDHAAIRQRDQSLTLALWVGTVSACSITQLQARRPAELRAAHGTVLHPRAVKRVSGATMYMGDLSRHAGSAMPPIIRHSVCANQRRTPQGRVQITRACVHAAGAACQVRAWGPPFRPAGRPAAGVPSRPARRRRP